jgi:hypothetical protein
VTVDTPTNLGRSSVVRYTDGTYFAEHPDWGEREARWKAEQVLRMMRKHQLSPRSICDMGCGTAGVLDHLSTHVSSDVRLVGYDVSPQALRLAGPRKDRLHLVQGDARACGEHFELMLALDVLEHADDYLGFLRALREKADRFIFHIPLDMTVQAVMRMAPIVHARRSSGHLHYFAEETALATLADTGYVVVDREFTRGGLEVAPPRFRTRVAAIPRRVAFALNRRLAARLLGGFSLLVLAENP